MERIKTDSLLTPLTSVATQCEEEINRLLTPDAVRASLRKRVSEQELGTSRVRSEFQDIYCGGITHLVRLQGKVSIHDIKVNPAISKNCGNLVGEALKKMGVAVLTLGSLQSKFNMYVADATEGFQFPKWIQGMLELVPESTVTFDTRTLHSFNQLRAQHRRQINMKLAIEKYLAIFGPVISERIKALQGREIVLGDDTFNSGASMVLYIGVLVKLGIRPDQIHPFALVNELRPQ